MHGIASYDEALKKAQEIEFDEDSYMAAIDQKTDDTCRLEQKLDLWCNICNTEGHTKDTCCHSENKIQYVRVIHT